MTTAIGFQRYLATIHPIDWNTVGELATTVPPRDVVRVMVEMLVCMIGASLLLMFIFNVAGDLAITVSLIMWGVLTAIALARLHRSYSCSLK